MKRLSIFCAVWLVIAYLQLEIAPLLEYFNESYAHEYINPFWSKSYVFPTYPGQPKGIIRVWWIKYVCNDLLRVMIAFVICVVTYQYSFRLFRVCSLFFFYHFIDHALIWYNYRSSGWHYILIHIFIIAAIISMFLPEKKRAIVKSMD